MNNEATRDYADLRKRLEAVYSSEKSQVFGGMLFREVAEKTGHSIDTLAARKRYAVRNVSRDSNAW